MPWFETVSPTTIYIQVMVWIRCALHYQITFGTPYFDPKAQLTTAQVKLLSIDQTWKIECAFLESLVDGSGSSKLEEDFLALLPTAEGGFDDNGTVEFYSPRVSSRKLAKTNNNSHSTYFRRFLIH